MKNRERKERQDRETRALAQQIRRNMITKVKPSAKAYSRKNQKRTGEPVYLPT